jgi:NAD(P)-dependent dehydrogenase (short-subunit alcohol dehydrogenase family)
VHSFARSWSAVLAPRKIRVNAVNPEAIDTPIFALEGGSAAQLEDTKRQMALQIPAGRMGETQEIAEAVLFLASDASRYMLGVEVVVDGGFAQL